jgi:hypothetical protein
MTYHAHLPNRQQVRKTVRANRVGVKDIPAGGTFNEDGSIFYHFKLYRIPKALRSFIEDNLGPYPEALLFDVDFTIGPEGNPRGWKNIGNVRYERCPRGR